jgi:hypothetical protein
VARVLFGDKIDQMQDEKEAFESTMERDSCDNNRLQSLS